MSLINCPDLVYGSHSHEPIELLQNQSWTDAKGQHPDSVAPDNCHNVIDDMHLVDHHGELEVPDEGINLLDWVIYQLSNYVTTIVQEQHKDALLSTFRGDLYV